MGTGERSGARASWLRALGAFLPLAALALVAYGPALRGGFVWDDGDWIARNETLRDLPGLARIWLEPGAVIQYYPLTQTSWWLDAQVLGLDPFAMHVENVLLHALGATLFWAMLRALALPGAFLAALVFLLHPVHVESVAWLVERKNVLSGALFLASALCWVRRDARGPDEPGRALYLASLGLFAAALLAKTAVLMLPVGLALLTWWRRRRLTRSDGVALAPYFALALAAALVTIRMERGEGAEGADWDLAPAERVLVAGRAVWFYLAKLAWPAHLSFVYEPWSIDAADLVQWLAPAALLAGALALFALRRRAPALTGAIGAAGAWFVVMLFPVLGFFDYYFMRYAYVADHFQYLASLAPIALFAAGAEAARRRFLPGHLAAAAGCALLALGLGALTWRQSHAYRDMASLWRATLATSPDAWMPHTNYGNLLLEEGDESEGIAHHMRAVELFPRAFESNNAVGNYFARMGQLDVAREYLDAALAARPDDALTWNNLGALETMSGDHAAAIDAFRQALRRDPGRPDVMMNLASLLASALPRELRKPADAAALAESALADPAQRTPAYLYVLFNAYAASGRREDALRAGAEALEAARRAGDGVLAGKLEERLRIVQSAQRP